MRIYVDSNVLISALQPEPNTVLAANLLNTTVDNTNELISSIIIYAEVLIAKSPLSKIQEFLDSAPINYKTVDELIIKAAAKLRKNHAGLHLADAIHLATAIHYSCEHLITDDKKLLNISEHYLASSTLSKFSF